MKEAVFSIPYSGLMSDSEWKTLEEEAEITKCRDLETGRAPDGYGWVFNPASHPSTEEHRTIWVRTCDEVFRMMIDDPRFELIEEITIDEIAFEGFRTEAEQDFIVGTPLDELLI